MEHCILHFDELSAYMSLTSVFGMGSEPTAASGGGKGGERVAGVGERRSRSVGKENTGHPNRKQVDRPPPVAEAATRAMCARRRHASEQPPKGRH